MTRKRVRQPAAKAKIKEVDWRTYPGSREKNTALVSVLGETLSAIRNRYLQIASVYTNSGTAAVVNRLTLKELAAQYGVPEITKTTGWKAKKKNTIYLVPVKDDRGYQVGVNIDSYATLVLMLAELRTLLPKGVKIQINSGFRTMSQQTVVYRRWVAYQKDPVAYVKLNKKTAPQAAVPGTSRHQMGHAIDIKELGHERDKKHQDSLQKILGKISPKYGWYRTVRKEAWHFSSDKFYPVFTSDGGGEAITKALSAVLGLMSGPLVSTERTAMSALVASLDAGSRANVLTTNTRKDNSDHSITLQPIQVTPGKTSAITAEMMLSTARNMSEFLPGFDPVVSPFVFNFSSGLWADGKTGGVV